MSQQNPNNHPQSFNSNSGIEYNGQNPINHNPNLTPNHPKAIFSPTYNNDSSSIVPFDSNNSTSLSNSQNFSAKPKPNSNFILNFFLFSIAIILLFGVGVLGLLTYAWVNPQTEFSQNLVNNSPLKEFISLPETDSKSKTDSNQSNPSNQKFETNSQSESSHQEARNFTFAKPEEAKTVTEVVEEVLPSVVSISVQAKDGDLDLSTNLTSGTGYIISQEGLIVTNKHVVAVSCIRGVNNVQIIALSNSQRAYTLKLLSIDPVDDIAILQIQNLEENDSLKPLEFANSNNLKLGQEVIAVGNALGELQNTVTKGIISGLERSFGTQLEDVCTGTDYNADSLIQTDAAINRGNSGGPLFNSAGQLIGMNTLGTQDAQNIGLAIPSSTLKVVFDSFQTNQKIVRARIGVSTRQVNPALQEQSSWLPVDYGEIIASNGENPPIYADSPASVAGLQEGDIILEFDGQKLVSSTTNPAPLRRLILSKQPGDAIELTIFKALNKEGSGFTYSENPQKILVTLGKISYNLEKSQVEF